MLANGTVKARRHTQTGKVRAERQTPSKNSPSSRPASPLVEALTTWAIPTTAIIGGVTLFVLYNVDVIGQAVAVIGVGALTFLLLLFFGLRGFSVSPISGTLSVALSGFAVFWIAATIYPLYRTVDPGTPVATAELQRNGPSVPLPLAGKPGRYDVIVEGRFLPTEDHTNRTATYHIALDQNGKTARVLEGTFSQEWGEQRVGSGRRSSMVPVLHETTERLDHIDDPNGIGLTARLTDLSPGVRDRVALRLYAESLSTVVLLVLGAAALAAAVVIDAWRPKGGSEGLMGTLTLATFFGIITFRASSVATPGFPQLVVAALVGMLGGAIAGSVLWRLMQPLRKHLPARP